MVPLWLSGSSCSYEKFEPNQHIDQGTILLVEFHGDLRFIELDFLQGKHGDLVEAYILMDDDPRVRRIPDETL